MFVLRLRVQLTLLNKLTMSGSHEGPLAGHARSGSLLIVNVLLMIFSGRPKTVGSVSTARFRCWGRLLSWERIIAFLGAIAVTWRS